MSWEHGPELEQLKDESLDGELGGGGAWWPHPPPSPAPSMESVQFHGPGLEPPLSPLHLHGSSHRWRRQKTPLLGLGFPVSISPQGVTWAVGRVCRDAEELIQCPVLQPPALPGVSSWCLGRRLRSQQLVMQDMQIMEEERPTGGVG